MKNKPVISDNQQKTTNSPTSSSRPRSFKWLYLLAIIPLGLGIAGWQSWSWWNWAISAPQAMASSDGNTTAKGVIVKVGPGSTGQQIGKELETAGLIRSATAWNWWSRWQKIDFKAGTYQFLPSESMESIAEKIATGQVIQVNFTIPEGWSLQQMAAYFETQGFFSAQDFLAEVRKIPSDKYTWLPQGLPHLEGFLYPDTYKIGGDLISPQGIIKQMLDRFQQLALPLYEKAKAENQTKMSLKDWVTLASIVEKEAVVGNERKVISGVFTNRLQKGMHLGADPTVEYGLGIKQTKEKPLTIAQVRTPNPYNTYVNLGLPPTPICSPGVASLEASLYPDQTEYLYFMARYDGTHIFSKTGAEHEAAISEVERQLR